MNKKIFYRDLVTGKFASLVKENTRGEIMNSSMEIFNMMKPLMADRPDVEQFWVVFMDAKNRILDVSCMFTGSIGSSVVHPREIIKKILDVQASAIVCCHNHPSGDQTPSPEDFVVTNQIMMALIPMSVSVHDHVIVGSEKYFSFADNGDLAKTRNKIKRFIEGGV